MRSPEELHRRGVEALNEGRLRRARELLEQARDGATGDLAARIDGSLAFLTAETGDPVGALELCDRALSRAGLAVQTVGVLQSQRALLLIRRGETAAALASYDLAIRSLHGLPAELGTALLNRGSLYLQQGRPEPAGADFARAAELFDAQGMRVDSAKARHNQGYAAFLVGDLVAALRLMDTARSVLAPLSAMAEAIGDQDRSEVLIAAGLAEDGRRTLREVARVWSSLRRHQRRGEAELALARMLVLPDPAGAVAAARSARRLFLRTGSDAWRVRADAVLVAAEVELGRSGPSLVARAEAVAADLDAQGLRWGAAQARLHAARVLVRRGRYDDARAVVTGVRLADRAPLGVRLLARTVRVELARAQGRRVAALQHARAGLTDLHAWQSSFGSLDLQTGVVGHGRRLGVHGLEVAVASGSPAVLHEWSERARMLAARITPVRPPADAVLAGDLAELRRLHVEGDGLQVPSPRRDAELRRRVRERAWQSRGSGEVTEPAPLADVMAGLGPDTALVAWVISSGRLVALVVTESDAGIHDLGSAQPARDLLAGLLPDLDMAATHLPGALAGVVRQGLVARLEDLGRLLVRPLLDDLGDRRVVMTPSGGLAGMPWTLLPGLVGRPVSVATSATSWLAQRRGAPALGRAGFVAGPRVARAEAEVVAAAARWPGATCLTGERATAEAVSGLAGRVDVLHVAAHGRHSADNPLFSGVELVGGPWFGYDIDLLPQVPAVVVLSACEVGRSAVRFGEELIGMTAAWLHAGVRCVVASPSAVNDEAAHDVLTAMHAGLARGLDPATALAAVVPPVGPDAPPAPFVCFGAGW